MTKVVPWKDVRAEFGRGSLLIGNGLSRSIWRLFEYGSLFQVARRFGLDGDDVALFKQFETTDFESILQALRTARRVGQALGQENEALDERYESIRSALIRAVSEVHVPWESLMSCKALFLLHDAMRTYHTVFSTNYDLIPYWALMRDPTSFRDMFWGDGNSFDLTNTTVDADTTRLLFVHGALHLYETEWGVTHKLVADGRRLVSMLGEDPDHVPLFVSEGSAQDKRRAIASSGYLNYVYQELLRERGPMTIFGQSLGDQDEHIASALDRPRVKIAIAIRLDQRASEVRRRTADYSRRLVRAELAFFDASTHPLAEVGRAAAGVVSQSG
jgi:hypothetical protein